MPAKAALVVLCLLVTGPLLSAAPKGNGGQPDWWRDGGPRLRPSDPRATAILQSGLERSATLRALVNQIDAADVVVYIAMRPTMGPEQAGGLSFISNAGTFRYLRIGINPGMAPDMLIATLGHELRHVVEVIENPEVKDEATLTALYKRIGRPSRILRGAGWETEQAQAAGNDVRRDLAANPVAAMAEAKKLINR